MPRFDYKQARADGVSDQQIDQFLAERKAAGEDWWIDQADLQPAVPAQPSRGPLDPLTPSSPLGASLGWMQRNTPEWIKRPASAVARGFADRLGATSAALFEPLAPAIQASGQAMKEKFAAVTGQPAPEPLPALPRMASVPDQLGQVGRALAFGESPIEGVDDPRLAMDELTRRTIGDYHALTPEQADAISRASLGLPTGEIARSMLGTEGAALIGMTPAARMMDAAVSIPFQAGRAAVGRVPFVAEREAVKAAKSKAVRQQVAEEAEQAIELDRLKKATDQAAKAQGETFDVVDRRVREARMMPTSRGAVPLTPEEQAIKAGYEQFGQGQVTQNVAAGLKPGVKGAHIETLRQRALAGNAKALKRLNQKLEPSKLKVGTTQELQDLPGQLAGYAPQAISKKALEIKRAEKLEPIDMPARGGKAFSAAQVERILTDRTKTAMEKEAAFAAKHPDAVEPLFKGHFESAVVRGQGAARRRAAKLFLDDLGRRLGKPADRVPKDGTWVRLTTIPMGKSGITKAEMARLEGIAIPARAAKRAQAAINVIQDSSLGEAKNLLDSAARGWKTWVLLRTGFTARNTADNSIATWAGGGRADFGIPAAKALAYSLGKADQVGNEIVPGLGVTFKEYVRQARRNGAIAGGFSQEIPKLTTGKNLFERKVLSPFRDVNAANENYWRIVLDMSKRAERMAPEESGAWVDDILGKFGRQFLSQREQRLANVFPWYNWIKQVTKRSLVLGTSAPGRIGQAAQAVTEINRGQGFAPKEVEALGPDVKESGAIVRRLPKSEQLEEGDVGVFPGTFYGPTDINRLFGTRELGPLAVLANPANQTYPPIQWLVAGGGLDVYRGRPFKGADVELPSNAAATLYMRYPGLAQKLGVRPISEAGKTRWMGPDKLAFIMRQSGPIGMALADIGSADPDANKRARAFFLGFSETIRNPKISEDIEGYREKRAMDEQKSTLRSSAFAEERLRKEMRERAADGK